MTIQELLIRTDNQISLLRTLVKSHASDLKEYPTGKYSLNSFITIEHCHDTLKRLNDLLAKPFESDKE